MPRLSRRARFVSRELLSFELTKERPLQKGLKELVVCLEQEPKFRDVLSVESRNPSGEFGREFEPA